MPDQLRLVDRRQEINPAVTVVIPRFGCDNEWLVAEKTLPCGVRTLGGNPGIFSDFRF